MMTLNQAADIVNRYVCAVCWGSLAALRSDEGFYPVCINHECGECDGTGFVTARYANNRRESSKYELMEVKEHYPYLFKQQPKQTEAQILQTLGF